MTGFIFGLIVGAISGFSLAAILAVASHDREGRL